MLPEQVIIEALNARLNAYAVPRNIKVAWPNVPFDPSPSTAYLLPTLLPARTEGAALGADADNRFLGVYQIGIYWPENQGEISAIKRAGEIAMHFKRGTTLTQNGRPVRINAPPFLSPRFGPTDGFIMYPLNVPYWSDLPNGDIP